MKIYRRIQNLYDALETNLVHAGAPRPKIDGAVVTPIFQSANYLMGDESTYEMAADGWEYVRAETLPCDERKGLTSTQTTYQNLLIFKRFKGQAQPLPLDERTTSRPLEFEAEPPSRPVSTPVSPRRVTTQPPEPSNAPPLGSPRDD